MHSNNFKKLILDKKKFLNHFIFPQKSRLRADGWTGRDSLES